MGKFFFGFLNDVLVTVEEFIDGHFAKYINGDGKCKTLPLGDMKHAYQKAQPLVYCSYKLSKRKFMLLDIRENMNNLQDPEIATSELFDGEGEIYFCPRNLSELAISNFVKEHVCSEYCGMLALETLLSSNDGENANLGRDSDKQIFVKEYIYRVIALQKN